MGGVIKLVILNLKKNQTLITFVQFFCSKYTKVVVVDRIFDSFMTQLRWSWLTGGRCSEVDSVLKLLEGDLEWSLLTGGRCSEEVVNTGLTVHVYVSSMLHRIW